MAETLQPLGPNQERWLKALESGEWKQGRWQLCHGDGHCCLGVAAKLFSEMRIEQESSGHTRWWSPDGVSYSSICPPDAQEALSLYGYCGEAAAREDHQSLASLNDNVTPFPEIAAIIRRDPSVYFREPR